MKKILVLSLFVFLLSPAVSFAQEEELVSPGLTPDSPFYFLERIIEGIGTFFTFGDLAKAKRFAVLAEERLAEAEALVEKAKPEVAKKALERYQEQLGESLARAEKVRQKGKDVLEVTEIVVKATGKHLGVLERVLEKVPEQAKEAIFQAREVSQIGQIRALENLAKADPKKAAELTSKELKEKMIKIKEGARERYAKKVERFLNDFEDLKMTLERVGREHKVLSAVEKMTEHIDDLDEIEKDIEEQFRRVAPELIEKVKLLRKGSVAGHIEMLREIAKEDSEKAAEIFSQAAEKRINKARQESEEEDPEGVAGATEEFERYVSFGEEISAIAQETAEDPSKIDELVAKATSHHLEVLADIYKKVPEQAKEAIEEAMAASATCRERAMEALREGGVLERIEEEIKEVPLPPEVEEKMIELVTCCLGEVCLKQNRKNCEWAGGRVVDAPSCYPNPCVSEEQRQIQEREAEQRRIQEQKEVPGPKEEPEKRMFQEREVEKRMFQEEKMPLLPPPEELEKEVEETIEKLMEPEEKTFIE